MESATFQHPTFTFDEKIAIHRNAERLVDRIEIGNIAKVDNTVTIEYEDGRPFSLRQTKYGAFDDVTYFSYDKNGDIDGIVYSPTLSVRNTKTLSKSNTLGKAVEATGIVTLGAIKRSKGVDMVDIQNDSEGLPRSTKTNLDASKWYFTDGKSEFEWKGGELKSIKLEQEVIPVNDRKSINFEY